MDNGFPPLDEIGEIDKSELSENDLAVLQAFEAIENWPSAPVRAGTSQSSDSTFVASSSLTSAIIPQNDDDMLMIFVAEAEEDIASMQQMLEYLKQDDHINPARFVRLQRLGHKLHGTAGAVDFPVMSTVASHVEVIAEQVTEEKIYPVVGIYALSQAIATLERYLREIISHGKEPESAVFLATLDATYRNLNIDLLLASEKEAVPTDVVSTPKLLADVIDPYEDAGDVQGEKIVSARITAPLSLESVPEASQYLRGNTRIDVKRFEKLSQHIEQLVELRIVLEDARKEAEEALQDLNVAQTRLQHLEPMLSLFLTSSTLPQKFGEAISSSLIARILNEAIQRRGPLSFRKSRLQLRSAAVPTTTAWDELDMEQYSEKDLLVRSLKEAIADVSLTTARLQAAHAHLAMVQQEYVSRVAAVRSATLQMRQAPLSVLIPRLQRVVAMSALAQTQQVQFEVTGETTEIDQDTLEALAFPLVQLLRTCIADTVTSTDGTEQGLSRVWLHIWEADSEIIIEIGFSMTVHGGAIDAIGDSIQRLNGKMSLQRNGDGGLSFLLHIPRLQGAVRCLLVRVGLQKLVIPFSQIRRIVDRQGQIFDRIYHLRDLLGFPSPVAPILVEQAQSVLVMQETEFSQIGVAIDEVIGEMELFVKPLKSYLQRPGIMGTAIAGKGNVTLMVDLPSLMRHYTHSVTLSGTWEAKQDAAKPNPLTKQIRVLVADDAVYLRHSVRQTLQYANYTVIEARDGMEAIEKLQESVPEVCVLDVEMPNLNGYDVLNMVHQTPEFKSMKVIMLTSRSSEKHQMHAMELGAHAYLTKPCSQETLLTTIQELLTSH
ncbi:MAG TPA: response regulator [Ktedonobacteraceae bacterium]|nr:response regulator [Ktedonobacteraceae bacterium]